MVAALVSSTIAAGKCSGFVPPLDLVLGEGVVVPLDSLLGVVVVLEDFGVGAVSGIFGGLAEPVDGRGLVARGVSEAFGVGVTAPGVVGVGVIGVVGVGVTAVGAGVTATIVGCALGALSLSKAA